MSAPVADASPSPAPALAPLAPQPNCGGVCETHPWHLHGHDFWIVGTYEGQVRRPPPPTGNVARATIRALTRRARPFGLSL